MKFKKITVSILAVIMALLGSVFVAPATWAEDGVFGFSVSPMTESIVLVPGDTYHGSFKVVNPNSSDRDLSYTIEKRSFYVDDEYNTTYDDESSPIVGWTTFDNETGKVSPNNSVDVHFTINVPENAPAGGQYLAFRVSSLPSEVVPNTTDAAVIQEQFTITHLIFAEIAGNTTRTGEISSVSVPSFIFSGDIYGESTIRNTGNIHGVATYKLQVFPLFSSEEVYSNEEDPEKHTILPDRALYVKTNWNKTPDVGIFNVVYTTEFEGVTAQVSKLVIKCPIWLMVLILAIIVAIIVWVIIAMKKHSKKSRQE